MNNQDLISVIVPVYNVASWLKQCLNSIINQTYKNIEIICVEDCSDDNSNKILEEFKNLDSRIVIIKNKKNMGLGESRNIGMSYAKGKWIHFVDSDDWLETDAYQKLLEKLNSLDFEPDLLFFTYKRYYEYNKTYEKIEYKNKEILDKNLNPLENFEAFDNWDRYAWIKLHKQKFLKDNNIVFNNYRCMEDIEYAADLYLRAKSICYTDICCVNYRQRENSLVSKTLQHIDCKVKSFLYTRPLFEKLDKNIRYKLLGFDYILIFEDLERAWLKGYISLPYLLYAVFKINKSDVKNYTRNSQTLKERGEIIKLFPMLKNKYITYNENLKKIDRIKRISILCVKKFLKRHKYWYRKIFSIQNQINSNGNKRKCLTIAGVKFKFKIN